ncbi:hypothetical protein H7142_00560, partial [Candidatus Saccharibacteria bacterium]|nr:hypothetical protein [Candidatus Saccharibacteria bacterium]
MSVAERAFNTVFPTADELWERGGAEIINGIPYYTDLSIEGDPTEIKTKDLFVKDGFRRRKIGSSALLGFTMNDGIDRLVSVRTLNDEY